MIEEGNKPNDELYYLQDNRSYVGNCVLWWRKGGCGYTTDILQAEVYSKEEAFKQHLCRDSDIPRKKSEIDKIISHTVNMQYLYKLGD